MKEEWSDDEIIEAVKYGSEKRQSALRHIYRNSILRERVLNYVKHKGGGEKEANEIFTEAVIVVDRNLRYDKFNRQSSITTYTYGIAKLLWMNHHRRKNNDIKVVSLEDDRIEVSDLKCPELIFVQKELQEKLGKLLNLLNEKCRTILQLWSNDVNYDQIAVELGVKKGAGLRKQKLLCMRKLKEHLLLNPELIPTQYHGRFAK